MRRIADLKEIRKNIRDDDKKKKHHKNEGNEREIREI